MIPSRASLMILPSAVRASRSEAGASIHPSELAETSRPSDVSHFHAVLLQQISLPLPDLCREVARLFGVGRVSERLEAAVKAGVLLHEGRGKCVINDGVASLAQR